MDWKLKAALTGAAVLMVMAVMRWGGRRTAGLAAALPIITAPTLGWLSHESSVAFAVEAAIGSVAACAMLAAFALCYARAARVGGAFAALLAGLAGAALTALPAEWASGQLVDALAVAFLGCALARAAMPDEPVVAQGRPASPLSMGAVACVASVISLIAASIGPSIGGFATGLVSSLPLITGAVAMAEHATAGHRAAGRFLSGYVGGLFGKAMFGCVFAVLAPLTGAPLALLSGCLAAALMSALQWRLGPLEAMAAPAP